MTHSQPPQGSPDSPINAGVELMADWQPIETAPKDGRVIIVMHEDVGSFPMAWNPTATNHLFAPDKMGMWEMADRSMTWSDADNAGPSLWRPLS